MRYGIYVPALPDFSSLPQGAAILGDPADSGRIVKIGQPDERFAFSCQAAAQQTHIHRVPEKLVMIGTWDAERGEGRLFLDCGRVFEAWVGRAPDHRDLRLP